MASSRDVANANSAPGQTQNLNDATREPPSYEDHLKSPASAAGTGHLLGSAGVSPVPPRNHFSPSAQDGNSICGDGPRRAPSSTVDASAWSRRKRRIKAELERRKWTLFAIGNVISAAVVISEISKLDVCFDEDLEDSNPDADSETQAEAVEKSASSVYALMVMTLIFGLWVDVFSAFALSAIYKMPLDIKSVHKVPPNDMRHCGGSVMVHFLAPLSWAIIYTFGGGVGLIYWSHSPCEGVEGNGFRVYLAVSGFIMFLVGLVMLALSVLILPFSCGSPTERTDRCCSAFRRKMHKYVSSKGRLLEIAWKVQGAIWAFRGGRHRLAGTLVAAAGIVVGDVMATCDSLTPDIVQALVGPLG